MCQSKKIGVYSQKIYQNFVSNPVSSYLSSENMVKQQKTADKPPFLLTDTDADVQPALVRRTCHMHHKSNMFH